MCDVTEKNFQNYQQFFCLNFMLKIVFSVIFLYVLFLHHVLPTVLIIKNNVVSILK